LSILILGLLHFDRLVIAFGILLCVFTVDFSLIQQDNLMGEYVAFKNLKHQDSSVSKQIVCMQMALYFLEDEKMLPFFTNTLWDQVKTVASPNTLSDILYYTFLSIADHSSLEISNHFFSDVHRTVLQWIADISIASPQWWFVSLYIVWVRNYHKSDLLQEVVTKLRDEKNKSKIKIASIATLRSNAFDSLIDFSQNGYVNCGKGNKRQFKILYKNFYCEIVSSYYRAYKKELLRIEKKPEKGF
jgi:hypothetical protein